MGMTSQRPRGRMILTVSGYFGQEYRYEIKSLTKLYLFAAGGIDNFVIFTPVEFGQISGVSLYLVGPRLNRLSQT